jgi:polygalacturonase
MTRRIVFVFLVSFTLVSVLTAQDTRVVTEPFYPTVCTEVDAQLQSVGHTLAPADEQKLDTARIQKAIDTCGRGHAVMLHVKEGKNAFLSGPLVLKQDITLIVGLGVTLYGSRDPRVYDVTPGSCGLVNESPRGCKPLISIDHAKNIAIMGDGVIDGRGGERMIGSNFSWWDLAEQARAGGRQQVPRIIVADYADNFTLYRITLKNSPNFHVVYNHGNGFTVWGLRIDTPQRLARNTDGVDPGNGSKNITITHSYIRAGDDNVAIKGGGEGLTDMTVSHNHFYWGHGMSIGSETDGGVSRIRVTDLSLDGPDNGIRIKSNGSRGGLTHDVIYDDVCIRNSPNPITLDTGYTANGPVKGNSPPTMRDITLHNVRISGGGKFSFNGYDTTHRVASILDGVQITDESAYTFSLHHADLTLGPGRTNLHFPAGEDSNVQGVPAEGAPPSCEDKFVPFPQ